MNRSYRIVFIGLGILIFLNYLQFYLTNSTDEPTGVLLSFLNPVLVSVFVFWHGKYRLGWKNMLTFFAVVFAVGWSFESLSVHTGFPFGWYNYSDKFGPKLGVVPVMIMPSYFAFGYLSWTMASIFTGRYDNKLTASETLIIPIAASFIMSAWDLGGDIIWSTVDGYWTWTHGGEFFGVPVTNYLGWYVVVFVFFVIFAVFVRKTNSFEPEPISQSKWYWILPAIMYGSAFVQWLSSYLFKSNRQVTSLDEHSWWTTDIYGSAVLIGLWTSVPLVLYSIFRVVRDQNEARSAVRSAIRSGIDIQRRFGNQEGEETSRIFRKII